ncbi:MAG: hypothetical protein J6C32_11510 [Eubacterium sp.]|nr:hypothetical protein [Eubacterium sp.]
MNWLRRFMYGRYGNDQLSTFLFVFYLILVVFQMIFRNSAAGRVLMLLSYVVVLAYFSAVSQKIYTKGRGRTRGFCSYGIQ